MATRKKAKKEKSCKRKLRKKLKKLKKLKKEKDSILIFSKNASHNICVRGVFFYN